MTEITFFYIITVFTAGILSFFAPCIVPLLPVYVSNLVDNVSEVSPMKEKFRIHWKLVFRTLIFVSGLGTTFLLLGLGTSLLGSYINSRVFLIIGGIIVIFLGLNQTGIFNFMFLQREKKLNISTEKKGVVGAYLLGLGFSFGWTPCVGPILASVLVISSNSGKEFYGVLLMLVYTLGLSIPFLLISVFTDYLLTTFKKINKHLPKIKLVGGILIIIMGIFLLTNNFGFLNSLLY